jgi:hypothetical protein
VTSSYKTAFNTYIKNEIQLPNLHGYFLNTALLSSFQIQVVKWTGDSGSKPEQAYSDKLLVCQLIRKGTSGCRIKLAQEDRRTE